MRNRIQWIIIRLKLDYDELFENSVISHLLLEENFFDTFSIVLKILIQYFYTSLRLDHFLHTLKCHFSTLHIILLPYILSYDQSNTILNFFQNFVYFESNIFTHLDLIFYKFYNPYRSFFQTSCYKIDLIPF